jgi:RNA 2',3'-cyclic 3'-phosphodiesterase
VEKLRVFLGIGPVEPAWARDLQNWVARVESRFGDLRENPIRWTASDNLHITLRFFGSVSSDDCVRITEVVAPIVAGRKRFTLGTSGITLFPNPQQPRIAAVEFNESSGELANLEELVRRETATIGQAPEQRKFRPHVTFGRMRELNGRARRAIAETWANERPPKLPEWPVTHATLFRSELRPGGPIYTPLANFPLS